MVSPIPSLIFLLVAAAFANANEATIAEAQNPLRLNGTVSSRGEIYCPR